MQVQVRWSEAFSNSVQVFRPAGFKTREIHASALNRRSCGPLGYKRLRKTRPNARVARKCGQGVQYRVGPMGDCLQEGKFLSWITSLTGATTEWSIEDIAFEDLSIKIVGIECNVFGTERDCGLIGSVSVQTAMDPVRAMFAIRRHMSASLRCFSRDHSLKG
jgi:hypothetical protein